MNILNAVAWKALLFIGILVVTSLARAIASPDEMELHRFLQAYPAETIVVDNIRKLLTTPNVEDPVKKQFFQCFVTQLDMQALRAALLVQAQTQFRDSEHLEEINVLLESPSGPEISDQFLGVRPKRVHHLQKNALVVPEEGINLTAKESEQIAKFKGRKAAKELMSFSARIPLVFEDRAVVESISRTRETCLRQMQPPRPSKE